MSKIHRRYRGGKPVGAREVVMLATSLTILAAACYAADQAPAPTTDPELPVMELVVVEPTTEDFLVVDPVPDEDEAEQIEAALVCQGYFREDIPLTFENQDLLHTACEEFGVPYELAVAVIWKETNFRNITGDSGKSYGYMQVKKDCHEARMAELGAVDLMDPYTNFRVGCHYLAELLEKYDGNVEMALMAFNAGAGGANKYWFSQGVYSNKYSQAVIGYMDGLMEGAKDNVLLDG